MKQFLTLLYLFIFGTLFGQVNIQLQLTPPFSPYFADYLAYENKTILIINKPSTQNLDIYFKGKVIGDNGLSLITKPNYKPGTAINLNKPVTILRGGELEPYFTQNNVDVNGANIQSYITNGGLPEGNYTVCLQPFDYTTDLPVGQEICTSFIIKSIEPPILIQPMCNGNVNFNPAQNIVFNWAQGGGSPFNTKYVLKMVELLDGQVPNNVLDAITTPPFFEKEINTTTYVYKLSDPKLTIGKIYAWQVTAFDPMGKVFFRNNGVSAPCTFKYLQNLLPPAIPGTAGMPKLYITYPDCKGNTNSFVTVSNDVALAISWNWTVKNKAGTKDSAFFMTIKNKAGTKDSLVLPHQPIANKTLVKYKLEFKSIGKQGVNRTSVSENLNFSEEVVVGGKFNYQMDLNTCQNKGLKTDHWYSIKVTALDNTNQKVEEYSCEFRYQEKINIKKDVIIVRGALKYLFNSDSSQRYPANNVPLKLSISNTKVNNVIEPISFAGPSSNNVIFTNSEGFFYCEVPNKKVITEKYLNIIIKNPYYKQILKTIPLFIKNKSATLGQPDMITYKDTIDLADVIAEVYNVSLKVNVGKGFPAFYVDTTDGKKAMSSNSYEVDTLTINAKAPVPEGLPIILYRKIKAANIPYYEGQGVSVYNFFGEKLISVAIAKTTKEVVNGKTKMIVKFDKLLPSFYDEDQYFIRAVVKPKVPKKNPSNSSASSGFVKNYSFNGLDKKDVGLNLANGNNKNGTKQNNRSTEFLGLSDLEIKNSLAFAGGKDSNLEDEIEAPIQEVKFSESYLGFNNKVLKYNKEIDYKLISTTPPTSKVKGRLMYKWPSDGSSTLYPLKNHTFSIKLKYKVNSEDYEQKVGAGLKYKINYLYDEKGNEIDTRDNELVVGTGVTDGTGNFEITIINQNIKGVLAAKGRVESKSFDLTPPKQNPKGTTLGDIKESFSNPVVNPADLLGQFEQINFEQGIGAISGYNQTSSINTSNLAIQGLENLGASNGAGIKNKAGGLNLNGNLKGPQHAITLENNADENNIKIERVLVFELLDQHINDPSKDFICQAFDTKNLSLVSSNVKESGHMMQLKSKNNEVISFTNARAIVFRLGAKPDDIPDGEGTALHPMKALLKAKNSNNQIENASGASGLNNAANEKFEWVIDQILEPKGNGFDFSGLKLLEKTEAANYYVQICPSIQISGTFFKPIIIPFGQPSVSIELSPSRIAGRIQDASVKNTTQKGLNGAWVEIKNLKSGKTKIINVDKDGYFEYLNFVFLSFKTWDDNTAFEISAFAFGYKSETVKATLNKLGSQYVNSFMLEPASSVKGKVVNYEKDEKGILKTVNVESFIVRANSSVYSTNADGSFAIPVPSLSMQTMTIIPKDIKYFDSTLKFNAVKAVNNLDEIYVKKRLHRMRFQIKDENGALIKNTNFKININNEKETTTSNGVGEFMFANVSINNFNVLVKDANGDYIPQIMQVKNNETKSFVLYDITLKKGAMVSGNVKLDGVNLRHALVYIDYKASNQSLSAYSNMNYNTINTGFGSQNTGNNEYLPITFYNLENKTPNGITLNQNNGIAVLKTWTNANGDYTIKGIPPDVNSIKVYATMDTSFTVIGDNQALNFSNNSATANFDLKKFNKMKIDNLWGFPFHVESIINNSKSNETTVSGQVDLNVCESPFDLAELKNSYRINNVTFKTNGTASAIPKDNEVLIDDVSTLKVKYRSKYNVMLMSKLPSATNVNPLSPSTTPLKIQNENGKGTVAGFAKIVDNSFNFPSTYLNFQNTDEFYLSRNDNGTINQEVKVLRALDNSNNNKNPLYNSISFYGSSTQLDYNLCNKSKGPIKFKFLEFPAKANPLKSYIDNKGKIHLNMDMTCKMANAQPSQFDVHIDNLVLDNNKIETVTGANPINIKLEDWTLEVNNWKISPEKGGLYSYSSILKTGFVDVPVDTFNLTSKLFYFGGFKLKELSLGGGILALSQVSPNVSLVYDLNTGSDNSPHWKMNVLPNGPFPAAKIANLNKILDGSIDIQSMQLLSKSNESIISIRQRSTPYKLYNNNNVKFSPQALSSSANAFSLIGALKFENVPRLNDYSVILDFTKPNGQLKADIKNLKLSFEAPGYCQFKNDATVPVSLSDGLFEIVGDIEEKGQFNAVKSILRIGQNEPSVARIYLPNNSGNFGKSTLPANYEMPLDASSASASQFNLKLSSDIAKNGLWLENGDWNLMKFSGNMIDKSPGSMIKASNSMDFVVHGEIKANSNELAVNDIATPFGALALTYIFPEKKMIGMLHVNQQEFGSWSIEGADLEMEFSPQGWYLLGCGKLNTGTLLVEGLGTFNAGFLFGSHDISTSMRSKLTQFAITGQSCGYLKDNASNFKGFFFTGGYNIIDKNISKDFVIVSGFVKAQLGVEGSMALNLNSSTDKFFIGVAAAGQVAAGMSAITGTSLCAGMKTTLYAEAKGGDLKNITIAGGSDFTATGKVKQWVPFFDDIELSADFNAHIKFGLKPLGSPKFNMDWGLGFNNAGKSECANSQICN
jgi:hypothetical protein